VYSHLRPSTRRINDEINNGKLKLLNYICYMGRIALSPSIHTNMVASIRGRSVLSNKAFRVDRTSAVLYARTAVRAYVYSACQPWADSILLRIFPVFRAASQVQSKVHLYQCICIRPMLIFAPPRALFYDVRRWIILQG
jgi:hypothetical protein